MHSDDKFKIIIQSMAESGIGDDDFFCLAQQLLRFWEISEADCADLLSDWYFTRGNHVNCLIACSYYCMAAENELFAVVAAKYQAYIEAYRANYDYNIKHLKVYQWCPLEKFTPYDQLEDVLVYQDSSQLLYINRITGEMRAIKKDLAAFQSQTERYILLAGFSHIEPLVFMESLIKLKTDGFLQKRPVYIYYKGEADFLCLLQTGQLAGLLAGGRVVFLLGMVQLQEFLSDFQVFDVQEVYCGSLITATEQWDIEHQIAFFVPDKEDQYKKNRQKYFSWARECEELSRSRIKNKSPRILFTTTRFSTAIQYHIRDCAEACRRIGCEVVICIEKTDIHCLFYQYLIEVMCSFKPDIVFAIDYFKNKNIVSPNTVHVCWAQDPLPHIMDKQTPLTLDNNQYILAHYPSPKELITIGYQPDKIIPALVTANDAIYHPHNLSTDEKMRYGADIVLVANASCYETHLQNFRQRFAAMEEQVVEGCVQVFREFYKLVYEEKIDFGARKEMDIYLEKSLVMAKMSINLPHNAFRQIAEYFYRYTRAVAFRSVLVEWLIDGGYTNLKLYGGDWGDNPKFKPYAMGAAENGEPLAKIYQAAKITLGTNPGTTGAARFYECYLSGGFYISNYIEPENDVVDLRDRFIEGEEVPFFYGRQDLYNKLDTYLGKEELRVQISNKVRAKMLKTSTYEILIRDMLQWLSEKVGEKDA